MGRAIVILGLLALVVCFCVINISAESTIPKNTDYGNVPDPYYTSTAQQYGIDTLQEYLRHKKWNIDYKPDVFDCSEMSALLECVLENEGFHTYILIGQYNNGWHAWLAVETSPNKYIIVEATTLTVIVRGDAEYNKYYGIDQYETIYGALKVSQSAFDWWNKTGGL